MNKVIAKESYYSAKADIRIAKELEKGKIKGEQDTRS